MISEFVEGRSTVLPTAEGLDVLLSMLEHCKYISGIMDFAEEVAFLFLCFCFCPVFILIFEQLLSYMKLAAKGDFSCILS